MNEIQKQTISEIKEFIKMKSFEKSNNKDVIIKLSVLLLKCLEKTKDEKF